jgi:hypothetical protein
MPAAPRLGIWWQAHPWSMHIARGAAGPGGPGVAVGARPCRAYSNCHPRPRRELCQRTERSAHGSRSNPGCGIRRHGPSPESARGAGLRIVGLTKVAGYLGERLVRQRLRPSGWDALESPLIMAALGLSVGMAALGNLSPAWS